MKRCPECGREYDLSMSFCLDDGRELLYGPAMSKPPVSAGGQFDEPQTAILHETAPPVEAPTRAQIHTTERTELPPSGGVEVSRSAGFDKRMLIVPLALGVVLLVVVFGYRYFAAGDSQQIESIAVMPFVNESGNPDVEYLSDGMTESLISSLSNLPNLNVRPRSSVFRYKGKEADFQSIAKELRVQAILVGRIIQRGDDISLFVEMINVALDKVVWSNQYNRKQSDLVSLQSEIARDVSNKLKSKLSDADEAKITKTYTANPDAYQLYLRGNYYQTKYNEDGYRKAVEYYRQAIDLDPQYASAYIGVGRAHFIAAGWYAPTAEAMTQVKVNARKALDLDESLAEGHWLLAHYEEWYGWDWAAAEREAKRAIDLDPNVGHDAYGGYFAIMGRTDDYRREIELYQRFFPLDLDANYVLARAYLAIGQTDKSIEQALKTIDLDQNFAGGHRILGMAYAQKQMLAEAIVSLEKARSLERNPELVGCLGYVYGVAGRKTEALKLVEELKDSFNTLTPEYSIAMIYAGLDDKDKTFEWLNKAIDSRSGLIAFIKLDQTMDNLRSDSRFKDLLKRLNLPE